MTKTSQESKKKGKQFEGWTDRWTGEQSLNDWRWEREGRMQADLRRRDTSQGR